MAYSGQSLNFAPSKGSKRAHPDGLLADQGPPGVETLILGDKPRYTIIYIQTDGTATLVRNSDHDLAPPFLNLNKHGNVSYRKEDGTTHVGPFNIREAAYGDVYAVQFVVETDCGSKGKWRLTREPLEAIYPPRGPPQPYGTVREAELISRVPRSEMLACVWKNDKGNLQFADPASPGQIKKLHKTKVSLGGAEKQAPARLMFIWVKYATQEEGTVCDFSRQMYFAPGLASIPNYRLITFKSDQKLPLSARTISKDELKAIREKYTHRRPFPEIARLQLLSLNAAIAFVYAKRVQHHAVRRVVGTPTVEAPTDGSTTYKMTMQNPVKDADISEALKQFREGALAWLQPDDRSLQLKGAQVEICASEVAKSDDPAAPRALKVTFRVNGAAMEASWERTPEELADTRMKLEIPASRVTTRDFQNALPTEGYHYLITTTVDAESSVNKGDIMRQLLGYPVLAARAPPMDFSQAEPFVSRRGFELHQGQSEAVHHVLNPDSKVTIIVAPAGAGKTLTAVLAAIELILRDTTGTVRVCITSPLNYAVAAAAAEAMVEAVDSNGDLLFPMLALQSTSYLAGRGDSDSYHDSRLPVQLSMLQREKFAYLSQEEQDIADAAVVACAERFADLEDVTYAQLELEQEAAPEGESATDPIRKGLELLLQKRQPKIIFATNAVYERYAAELTDYVTHVIVDESGTAAHHNALSLAWSLKKPRKFALIGDPFQLTNHKTDVDLELQRYGFSSALDEAMSNGDIVRTRLTYTHRFQAALREFVTVFYGPLQGPANDESRNRFLKSGFPFPNVEVPLMMVGFWSYSSRGDEKSYTNKMQQDVAVSIATMARRLAPGLSIVIMSMYKSECDELRNRKLLPDDVIVQSVDKLQGQEADIAILLTTRTLSEDEFKSLDGGTSKMVHVGDPRRLVVGTTRMRQGLIVVGDIPSLQRCPAWNPVLQKIQAMTGPPVDLSYIRQLENLAVQRRTEMVMHRALSQTPSPGTAAAHALDNLAVASPPTTSPATPPQQAVVPTVAVTPMAQAAPPPTPQQPVLYDGPIPPPPPGPGPRPWPTYAASLAAPTPSASPRQTEQGSDDATAKAAAALSKPRRGRTERK